MTKGSLKHFAMLVCTALMLHHSPLCAETPSLRQQAEKFVYTRMQATLADGDLLDVSVRNPDSRLRLPPCQDSISFASPRPLKPGRFSLKASCAIPKRWSIHLSGRIQVLRNVVISERALPKNTVLNATDLQLAPKDIATLRQGFYTSIDQVVSYQLKRSVQQKHVLTPRLLSPPLLVRKNDEVVISAGRSSTVDIRVAGIALQDGHQNQQIRVRNKNSGKIIRARVIAIGEVRAGP